MSEFNFLVGQGRVSKAVASKVDAIVREEARSGAAGFTTPTLPGEGRRYWAYAPNRGEPFDSDLARRVWARLEAEHISLP